MLKLKPNCECCDIDLPPKSDMARICSFECTFCEKCAMGNFDNVCPNCGGEFVKRPIRPESHLAKHPASEDKFVNKAHANYANYASCGKQAD